MEGKIIQIEKTIEITEGERSYMVNMILDDLMTPNFDIFDEEGDIIEEDTPKGLRISEYCINNFL